MFKSASLSPRLVLALAALIGLGRGALAQSSAVRQPLGLSHQRGIYGRPFTLDVSKPADAGVWVTTDGSAPTPLNGRAWDGALIVSNTTTLRVAACRNEDLLGSIQTHTFLFPTQVPRQTGADFPPFWGVTNGHPVKADYEMDPDVANDSRYRDVLEPGLTSIPTLSVVMDRRDLFDADRGIYANPQQSGIPWERSASVELIYPDGRPGFQIDCGIRVQGGWNRRPEESPKHAFRLVFHERYGTARLRFALYGEPGVSEFETLILRAGCNNTWLHWSGEERRRGDYIRDRWMRDTVGAMGHPSARGLFVHLYLDGLYWGLYDLSERPSAPFAAAHYGGSPKEYDSRNADNILDGTVAAWKKLMRMANAGVAAPGEYEAIQLLLDLPEFIDYMLANLYGANGDWDRASNWYAARRRKPPGPFHFFVWDAERTLETVDASILDQDDDESPLRLFQKLRQNPEFRLAFADHAQRHLFNDGALAPEPAARRFEALARQIEQAVVLESARWGDYRRDVHPYRTGPFDLYNRDDHWRPEINRLLRDYFPMRGAELLKQLRAAGLYPLLDPPAVQRTNNEVVLNAPAAAVCFTCDGSDPRLPGGALSPRATVAEGRAVLGRPGRIRARAMREGNGDRTWSALLEL